MKVNIHFVLNNKEVLINANPTRRLLDVLRDDFQLMAAKDGCGEGECGACSVLLDGKLVNSCLIPIGMLDGNKILTIEGYRETKRFKVLKDSFEKAGSVQCGFCTPGVVMASEALLSKKAKPSDDEIRNAISGNLCRCTGYNMIIEGVKLAAKEGDGLW